MRSKHSRIYSNLYAYRADKLKKKYRSAVVDVLFEYDDDFGTPWNRTKESVLSEWKSHKAFAFASETAQNVDFDNKEEGKGFVYYCIKAIKAVFK